METLEQLAATLDFAASDAAVITTGLEKLSRPNLEILIEDEHLIPFAKRLLSEAAAYSVVKSKIGDGETVGIPVYRGGDEPVGHNVLRAIAVADKKGWFSRKKVSHIRLVSPLTQTKTDEMPALELATEILEVAHEANAAGATEKALELAAYAADVYPGEPIGDNPAEGQKLDNAENHHAYQLIHELTGSDGAFKEAFARSLRLQIKHLGIPAGDLEKMLSMYDSDQLASAAVAVQSVATEVTRSVMEDNELEPPEHIGPVLTLEHGDGDSSTCIMVTDIAPSLAKSYWSDESLEAMTSKDTVALVVEVLQKHREQPHMLALMTHFAIADWLEPSSETVPVPLPMVIGLEQIISAMLATIGLCSFFEFSTADLRVYFGLETEGVDEVASKLERMHTTRQAARSMLRFMGNLGADEEE